MVRNMVFLFQIPGQRVERILSHDTEFAKAVTEPAMAGVYFWWTLPLDLRKYPGIVVRKRIAREIQFFDEY